MLKAIGDDAKHAQVDPVMHTVKHAAPTQPPPALSSTKPTCSSTKLTTKLVQAAAKNRNAKGEWIHLISADVWC
jgi:hypothetical protein